MTKKIRHTGPVLPRIRNTSEKLGRVEPEVFAQAIGAERVGTISGFANEPVPRFPIRQGRDAVVRTKERLACHEAVDSLPEVALSELTDTLREMLDFYRARDVPLDVPSESKTWPSKVGRTYIRPEFHIEDDET